jgi:hypothetical protein
MITSHGFEVSFPTELSTQRTHPSLAIKPRNETQTFLDHGPFGRIGTGFKGCRHEFVVDHDIGSHDV